MAVLRLGMLLGGAFRGRAGGGMDMPTNAEHTPGNLPPERPAEDERSGKRPATMTVTVRALVGLFLWAVLLLVAFRFYNAVKFVVLGGMGAAVLAAAIQPLVNHLRGPMSLRAGAAMGAVVLVAAGALTGLGWLLYEPIRLNVERLPEIRRRANDGLQDFAATAGINGELTVEEAAGIAVKVLTGGEPSEWVPSVAGGVLTALLAVLVVVIGAAYLLARPSGSLSGPVSKLLPPDRAEATRRAVSSLQPQYRWWLVGTLFSMAVIGLIFGAGYWLIGLQFALPLAVFAAVAQVVPTFGPMVTLALSLLIAATQGTVQVLGVVGVYGVAQALESYVLTPMVMRQAVRIPPIVTLFTIILWGNVFGPGGLILAIPIDLTIWALLKHHLVEEPERREEAGES